jgi:RNA polymerase sigma-70 factor (sigma-E family)
MTADFDAFIRARTLALIRYGMVLTGNQHDAADLVQEALARLGERWSRIGEPEAYARTTMARLHVSWWRRRRRERLVSAVPDRGYVDAGIARADGDTGLWHALLALPPRQRVVIVLRYYEQRSDDDIAQLLGISRGTVRSQSARALEKLRRATLPPPGSPAPTREAADVRESG